MNAAGLGGTKRLVLQLEPCSYACHHWYLPFSCGEVIITSFTKKCASSGMGGFLLSGISPRAPKWVQVANNKEYGYSSLMVTPTTLEMKFISSLDGLVKDSFTLRK